MLLEFDLAPPGALAEACAFFADPERWEAVAGGAIAQRPIPVHRLRTALSGGWDAVVPQIGWDFPVFRGEELTQLLRVCPDGLGGYHAEALRPAGPGTAWYEALHDALALADSREEPYRIRLLEVPGAVAAYWLAGERDGFINTDPPYLMSAPEFASLVGRALRDPIADLDEDLD